MNRSPKKIFIFFLQNCIPWILASYLFGFFRFYGIPENIALVEYQEYIPIWMNLLLGTLAAIFYTGIELLFDTPRLKRISFGANLLGKAIASFICVKFMMAVAYFSLTFYHWSIALECS